MKLRSLLFFVLLVTFAATGCLFSPDKPDDVVVPPAPELPPAVSANQLVANFETAYNERNIEYYREVMSEDYKFISVDGENDYDYATDISIHERMFNEVAGEGGIVFDDISVISINGVEVWQPIQSNDQHFGSFADGYYRPYDVSIDFNVAGQSLTYQVRGLVIFYVTTAMVDGEEIYYLLGQSDNTVGN